MKLLEKSTVPNLQRGMAILEFLATHQNSATIAELSEQLGYPSASVFRIMQELENLGYLMRDLASKRYSLTSKFLLLGQPQGESRSLIEASTGAMRGLNRQTGETTQLLCLVETHSVVIEQFISTYPFKYSAQLGARCPAYSCAPGKVMIAFLPEDEREELISRMKFKQFTSTTITDRTAFRAELDQIVKCGYAVDRAEGLEGIHCVAAVIRDRHDFPAGAITIAAPSSRLPRSQFAEMGKCITEFARQAEVAYQS